MLATFALSGSAGYLAGGAAQPRLQRSRSSFSSSSSRVALDTVRMGEESLLDVEGLTADVAGNSILKGVNLKVKKGEVHAIMGPNGSGKSTFSKVLVGHPSYEVTGGKADFNGNDLLDLEPEERAQKGVFLAFQYPVEIPGVSNSDFLRLAVNKRRAAQGLEEYDPIEFMGVLAQKMDTVGMRMDFIGRDVNAGFSGGEKKRNEILQMALLEPELALELEKDGYAFLGAGVQ